VLLEGDVLALLLEGDVLEPLVLPLP